MVTSPHTTTILGDKYAVVRLLGHGGMGSVFEVENLVTHRRAALKRLQVRFDDLDDAESRRRVIHEARAMARVRHRNVVDVYDVFEDKGRVCLVMELLLGELLSKRVARGNIPLHRYVGWLLDAMRGVAAAHAAGVIHRDVKPENIVLSEDGSGGEPVPVVIDFGVSKLRAAEAGEPRAGGVTRSGIAMGTPRYVSYEQLRGVRDIDGRTDVYAFGVMLYEALVGVPPYEAATFAEQAISFLTTEPAQVCVRRPLVPAALGALAESAIARRRELRPATMQAFVDALTPFAQPSTYECELHAFPLAERAPSAPTEPSDVEALARANVARMAAAPELPTSREAPRGAGWLRRAALAAGLGAGTLASIALLLQSSAEPEPRGAARGGASAATARAVVQPSVARSPEPAGVQLAAPPALAAGSTDAAPAAQAGAGQGERSRVAGRRPARSPGAPSAADAPASPDAPEPTLPRAAGVAASPAAASGGEPTGSAEPHVDTRTPRAGPMSRREF